MYAFQGSPPPSSPRCEPGWLAGSTSLARARLGLRSAVAPVKNAAFRLLGDVGLVVHNARNPNREEWDAYLAMSLAATAVVGGDLARFRQIVFTDGGGPNLAQRRASADLAKGYKNGNKVKVAVVSRSVVARGIVTAFRWLGLPLRSFDPDQLAEAFAFLAVSSAEAVAICAAVEELCATVDGSIRSAARVSAYRIAISAELVTRRVAPELTSRQ